MNSVPNRAAQRMGMQPIGVTQPVPPGPAATPSPTSQETNQQVSVEDFNRDGLSKIGYLTGHGLPELELIDEESAGADGPQFEPDEELVTLNMTVVETVHYPAWVQVPQAAYDEMVRLFPVRDDQDLPLGLVSVMIRKAGGRIVVGERDGDVQGQHPAGPVRLERTDSGHQ